MVTHDPLLSEMTALQDLEGMREKFQKNLAPQEEGMESKSYSAGNTPPLSPNTAALQALEDLGGELSSLDPLIEAKKSKTSQVENLSSSITSLFRSTMTPTKPKRPASAINPTLTAARLITGPPSP